MFAPAFSVLSGLGLLLCWVVSGTAAEKAGWSGGWTEAGPGVAWRALAVPKSESGAVGFRRLLSGRTGIDFTNHLAESSAELNRILENGSGVAAGDVDGDGWCDLYFCRLEGGNVLYRNLGGFRFEDVTAASGAACAGQSSTGAVLVDIDGDGDSDLLVTGLGAGTRCFLNDSTGKFDEVAKSGLDRTAGSMSMALADADGDGDLDLYVANYQTVTWKDFPPGVKLRVSRVNGRPIVEPSDRFVGTLQEDGGVAITEIGQPDGFYLNEGRGRFRLAEWTGGRFLDEDGRPLAEPPRHWGLSVAFRDFNGDHLPDLYVCNDFLYGNDDFFLNTGAGVFRRIPREALRHSSWSSMAVDVADINRDGHFDFFVVDMLSQDLVRRLTQRANYATGIKLREAGEIFDRPQQQRNTLFLNRGDGTYTEIALLAGVEASEWSWSVVFLDADLDGYEDILVGNGNAHDLLDGDITIEAMVAMRAAPRGQTPRTLLMYPRLDLPDTAFRNRGDLTFEEVGDDWGFNLSGVSQGLCRADLDNDGDWDVAVNRLQSEAAVFENIGAAPRIRVQLQGRPPNTAGAGALVSLHSLEKAPAQRREMVVGGRYLSSDEPGLVFAAGGPGRRFRLEVLWPGGKQSIVEEAQPNRVYRLAEASSAVFAAATKPPAKEPLFADVSSMLNHVHRDVLFNDLQRQALLPNLFSQLGPGVNWADVDRDGFEDLIVPAGVGGRLAVLENLKGKGFRRREYAVAGADQQGAVWMNLRGDAFGLALGESNYRSGSRSVPSVRFHDLSGGKGEAAPALPGQRTTVGALTAFDYDRDGDLDLFVCGRVVPGRYPEPAISRLYRNEGGRFRLDLENSRQFASAGLVNGAGVSDLDGDGDGDLVLAVEWGHLQLWLNEAGQFREASRRFGLDRFKGWWNGVAFGDFDEDGRMDLAAANWGRNTKYERYRAHPIRLHFGDVDGNGAVEVFEMVYDKARSRWAAIRDLITLGTAIPALQNVVHSHRRYAEQGLDSFFGPAFEALQMREVNWLETTVFLNRGGRFAAQALPLEAQFAPVFGVAAGDFTGDGHEDLLLAQNFFATQPKTPRYDAGRGLLLEGRGDGSFAAWPADQSGIRVWGEQRGAAAADFDQDGRLDIAIGQNGATTKLFRNQKARPAHRVKLIGKPGNRDAVGARLRRKSEIGPAREIRSSAGYWSQDSPVTLWPARQEEQVLIVHWPNGGQSEVALRGPANEWIVEEPAEPLRPATPDRF